KYWQTEGRFGDEYIARHRRERLTGRVAPPLVVARDHGAAAAVLEQDLSASQYVPGRKKCRLHTVDVDRLPIGDGLSFTGHVSEPVSHDSERVAGGQHRAIAGPRMVCMPVRDQGTAGSAYRIDHEIAGSAIEPRRRDFQPIFWWRPD